MSETKDYQVVRYFKSGYRPVLIQDNLTLEQAQEICRHNNASYSEDEPKPRLWADIFQKRGLL